MYEDRLSWFSLPQGCSIFTLYRPTVLIEFPCLMINNNNNITQRYFWLKTLKFPQSDSCIKTGKLSFYQSQDSYSKYTWNIGMLLFSSRDILRMDGSSYLNTVFTISLSKIDCLISFCLTFWFNINELQTYQFSVVIPNLSMLIVDWHTCRLLYFTALITNTNAYRYCRCRCHCRGGYTRG